MNKEIKISGDEVLDLVLMMGGGDYTTSDLKRMPATANKLLDALCATDQTRFSLDKLETLALRHGIPYDAVFHSVIEKFTQRQILEYIWEGIPKGDAYYVPGQLLSKIKAKRYAYHFSLVAPGLADFLDFRY